MKERDFICFLLLHLLRDADELWSLIFTPGSAGGRLSQKSSRAMKPDALDTGALTPDGAFHPSVSSVCLNFSTAGVTPRFRSPPSIRQKCSLLPACTHPQALVSLGVPLPCCHTMVAAASTRSKLFAGPDGSSPLLVADAGAAWIICSTAITAEGPLAAY